MFKELEPLKKDFFEFSDLVSFTLFISLKAICL